MPLPCRSILRRDEPIGARADELLLSSVEERERRPVHVDDGEVVVDENHHVVGAVEDAPEANARFFCRPVRCLGRPAGVCLATSALARPLAAGTERAA